MPQLAYHHYHTLTELAHRNNYIIYAIADDYFLGYDSIQRQSVIVHFSHVHGEFLLNPYEAPLTFSKPSAATAYFASLINFN